MDRTRIKLLVGGVVILAAFAYLFRTGMEASQVYYLTVSEYGERASTLAPGDPFRVAGRVLPGSVVKGQDGLDLAFAVYDPAHRTHTLPVRYRGVIPDTFMEDSEVVVEGSMRSDTFEAHLLLAKCPSKYEALAEEEARREAEAAESGSARPASS